MKGTVAQLHERGFGFITGEDGKRYFFHHSAAEDFGGLQEGDPVSFEEDTGPRAAKGPRAQAVVAAEAVTR